MKAILLAAILALTACQNHDTGSSGCETPPDEDGRGQLAPIVHVPHP